MKKLLFLLACVACLGFTACSEEEKDAKKGGAIVGTWMYSEMEDYPSYYYIWVLSFTEDGRFAEMDAECYNETEYEDEYYGTYTYSGNNLVLYYDDGDVWALQASVSGNQLVLTDDVETCVFERYIEE
ncbi:MAG: lipocalin family protein [Alistipes sp.]|nr:lipocalin family protein [Alistipes sp.]